MMKLNFATKYSKLENTKYTTIRHKNKAIQVGKMVEVGVNYKYLHMARVVDAKVMKIRDIDLELIREDTKNSGYEISSHSEFVNLLGQFYSDCFDLDSEVCVMWLEVVHRRKCCVCDEPASQLVYDLEEDDPPFWPHDGVAYCHEHARNYSLVAEMSAHLFSRVTIEDYPYLKKYVIPELGKFFDSYAGEYFRDVDCPLCSNFHPISDRRYFSDPNLDAEIDPDDSSEGVWVCPVCGKRIASDGEVL